MELFCFVFGEMKTDTFKTQWMEPLAFKKDYKRTKSQCR